MSSDDEDDEEEKEFRRRISNFISSFSLNDAVTSASKTLNEYKKLNEELKEGYGTTEELIRTKTLISYLLWQLCERGTALEFCNCVLDCQKTNIIALSNKAWFMFCSKEFSEAKLLLGDLDKLSNTPDYKRLKNEAEAELAYSYSRFGPKCHGKSIELFEKVITGNQKNCLWKFGLALTYKRQTNSLSYPSSSKTDVDTCTLKALQLFHEITTSDSEDTVRAKAWCELGHIINWENLSNQKFRHFSEDIRSLKSEDCFIKALDLCPDDTFVLERCGRQFRYFKKLELSKNLLEKAITIREKPFSLHHLALTIIKQVEVENKSRPQVLRYFNREKESPKSVEVVSYSNQERSNIDDIVDDMSSLTLNTGPRQNTGMREATTNQTKETEKFSFRKTSHGPSTPKYYNLGRGKGGTGQRQWQTINSGRKRHVSLESPLNRLCIKSPMKTIIAPNNHQLLQAKSYLERAIALCGGKFLTASYDLGLVYRRLDKPEDAIKAFNDVALAKESTKLEKARANEQIGICKLLMSENKERSQEESSKYYNDAKVSLFQAVRQMASLCSNLPDLKHSLRCFPTLRSMLTQSKRFPSADSRKELADLHRLVGDYREAISFYEEVRDILKKETPGVVLLNLVESYKKIGDYENALLLLNMMWCSDDTRKVIPTKVYVSSHVDAWAHSVETKNYDQASHYLQDAYRVAKQNVLHTASLTRDVVILCKCDDLCEAYTLIKDSLEKMCGLSCKFNTDDCLPGRPEMDYLQEILEDCDLILLLVHDNDASQIYDFRVQNILANESFRRKTMLVADEAKHAMMKTLPKLKSPKEGTDMVKWIKDFLSFILKP